MDSAITLKMCDEMVFHDKWAKDINIEQLPIQESFEAITAIENQYILKEFESIKNKRILDLGCGAGESSIYFALKGANVTALDVSPGMLEVVESLANKNNVEIKTVWSSAEKLPFENNSFDLIYGNGVLHHTNYPEALNEVYRVLDNGGKAAFIEPLAHNFLINVYRKIASAVRTKDEKPFKIGQIKKMSKYIKGKVKHREFWLLSLYIFVDFYLKGINPEKERYWKKIIYDADKVKNKFKFLNKIDKKLLKMPFFRRYCWNSVIVIEK